MDDNELEGLYWKWPDEKENVRHFAAVMRQHPDVGFYRPSPTVAPWHWRAKVNGLVINFWPHKMKAQLDGEKAVTGKKGLHDVIKRAKAHRDFHVID